MLNLNVAVIGSQGYSKRVAKVGTKSDVTIYNLKKGENTVTLMEPTMYPEKLAPLAYSAFFADYAILVVEKLDTSFGESLLMLDAVGPENGAIILRNYITFEQVKRYISETKIAGYELCEDDEVKLRQRLLDRTTVPRICTGPGTVSVDHFFNVRGIGMVALGIVKKGEIKKHDDLRALPGDKVGQVRSIQKHDDDFIQAGLGDRVGVALKNLVSGDLSKGTVLTGDEGIRCTQEINAQVKLNPYWMNPLKTGMSIHVGHWMQFVSGKITNLVQDDDTTTLSISLDKPLVHPEGSKAVITYLDGGNMRIVGTVEL